MKRILRILLIVLALAAFAAAVWFAGPLLGFAERYPLSTVWARLLTIGLVWGAVGLYYGIRFWRARRAEKALEEAIIPAGPVGDGEVLGEKMQEALAVLRRSAGSSSYLYELPWYVIIGPPGAGKTTALLNSGVHFPLADKTGGAMPGAGGTRYCDWWFAEEAVLIDTAGRYTTQDSDEEADRESWVAFLDLLKRQRPRQPVNGVIVALSLEDLLTGTPETLEAHARAIRDRLMELYEVFRIEVPVYFLFTKADLIAGFDEFFGSFSASRRQKVWGTTFRPAKRNDPVLPLVSAEFDALVARLSAEVTDRMQEEPNGVLRIAIFGFPAQVAMLKDKLEQVLEGVFGTTRYKVNATLRGFYFTSGTQEGTPIDQILGAMERSFGGAVGAGASGKGKSYFLHDLLRKVIFQEAGWVSQDRRAVRREGVLRYGTMALILGGAIWLAAIWGNSFYQNYRLIGMAQAEISRYEALARPELDRNEIDSTDLSEIAPLLQALRELPLGYVDPEADTVGILERFGLSQRAALAASARAAYRDGLERMLRPRLILQLEERIAQDISQNNLLSLYEALKLYKLLGHAAPRPDDGFVVAWITSDWAEDPALRGSGPFRALRDELEAHLWAMLDLSATQSRARVELNGALVARAEQILSLMNLEDQAWLLVMGAGGPQDLEPFNLGLRAGPDADLVFETLDGQRLDELIVPAIYTHPGFHQYFLPRLAEVATKLESEQWVLGARAEAADVSGELRRLGAPIMNRYALEFTRAWNAVLDNVQLRPLSADSPQFLALNAASDLRQSPILKLTEELSRTTQLTRGFDEEGGFGAGLGQLAEGVGGERAQAAAGVVGSELLRRAQERATGLGQIGFDVLRSQRSESRAGAGATAGTRPEEALPGANVEAQFGRWHDLVEDTGDTRPIEVLLRDLQEIYRLLLTSTAGAGQVPPSLGQDLATQSALLTRHASRMPPQLSRMILQASEEFAGGAADTTLAALNDRLNREVTQVCESLVPDSYPFSGQSNRDLPPSEFARLFASGGVFDRFFNEALAPHADLSGDDWVWRSDSRLGAQMSPATLMQFQRADAIREAFFPGGSAIPGFDVTIRQTALHPEADIALLEVNGQQIVTQQQGSLPQTLFWPAAGGGSAAVQLGPELIGRESVLRVQNGPWALMRLINQGRPRAAGSSVNIRLDVGGRYVAYTVTSATTRNPFFLRELWDFRCPRGL
ncbi:type VI secretion system membrane subunit TssM [Roseinatronobacter alkalisoli]|uniref:Type VI secretion system membrane subunit TssM n=1 Tax=Roseinatronobacter alkalisoli TaxID=3028235 RepID=A0ABT5TA07_9RHOB|nr:type VI secretion system membrane subunit TssM [Roseinatronobacter sp. HJB301]MDD7971940.1 type VI secretion system membrane subunit TssM [Roseinatronobacter sp. HJB301]